MGMGCLCCRELWGQAAPWGTAGYALNPFTNPAQQPQEPHWLLATPRAPGAGAAETQGEWRAGPDPRKHKSGGTDPRKTS